MEYSEKIGLSASCTGNTRGSLAVGAWLLFHAIFGE